MPLDRNADTITRILRNWQRLRKSHVFGEIPSGDVDGSNDEFLLVNIPDGDIAVYQNGARLTPETDYTVTGKTITMTTPPTMGDVLLVDYVH